MKKSFFKLTILGGMLFLSVTTKAQQTKQTGASPKPPESKGKVLQVDKNVAEPTVSPANVEKPASTATDGKPSQAPLKVTKINEPDQPKANQENKQPTSIAPVRTDNLVVPNRKEIPDSKTQPTPAKIKE